MPTTLAGTQHAVPWPTLAATQDPAADLAAVLPAELAARREWLRQRRWQKPGLSRGLWLIVLVILLVHLAWVLVLRSASHPHELPVRASPVQVRLIEEVAAPPVTVPRELEALVVTAPQAGKASNSPAPPRAEAPARPVAPAAAQAGTAEAVVATPSVHLYNTDGSLLVPKTQESRKADPLAQGLAAAAEMQARGHNVVRCRSTRFAGAWKPDENVGDEAARKYLGWIGLYNPHSAAKTAERASDARSACDGDGF
jgi:hypothetical protein